MVGPRVETLATNYNYELRTTDYELLKAVSSVSTQALLERLSHVSRTLDDSDASL